MGALQVYHKLKGSKNSFYWAKQKNETEFQNRTGGEPRSGHSRDDVISYMHASEYRNTLFKGILEKRDTDRSDCFKKYPQK